MPEVFREMGFVFFFYANEGNEPMHVHVRKAGGFAKYWIEPIELEFSQGMKVNDLKLAERLISDRVELIKSKWNETSIPQFCFRALMIFTRVPSNSFKIINSMR